MGFPGSWAGMIPLKGKPQSHLEADDSLCGFQLWTEPSARHQNPGSKCPCDKDASPGHLVWAEANREELVTLCEVPLLEGLLRHLELGSVMQVQIDVLCERHLGGHGSGSSQQDSAWAVYALHCALWGIGKDSRHDPLYQQEFTIPLNTSLLPGDIPPPV